LRRNFFLDSVTTYGTKIEFTMTKAEKLLKKAKDSQNNLKFEELTKLAELAGFVFRKPKKKKKKPGTSHRIYTLPGKKEIMNFQNVHGKAVPYQVRQLLKAINEGSLIKEEKPTKEKNE